MADNKCSWSNKYELELNPKVGHWIVVILNNREHHVCSECNYVVDWEPMYHYCPYCGAELKGEEYK